MMWSTLIGAELDNNNNETEERKVDNGKEDQASVLLKKNKNEKYDTSITSTRKNNDTVEKEDISREMWIKRSMHILPPQKIRLTQ